MDDNNDLSISINQFWRFKTHLWPLFINVSADNNIRNTDMTRGHAEILSV